MNIFVTGATGFVGSHLLNCLNSSVKFTPTVSLRSNKKDFLSGFNKIIMDDLGPENDWGKSLDDIDVLIHTAARAHITNEQVNDPLQEYRKVNVEGTLNLARQAAASGVKRFIFISSINVNGESTRLNQAFNETSTPAPVDFTGISKYEAEVELFKLAKSCNMEVVCIRPPLVYGPDVKANFLTLMKLIDKNIPLPLGAIKNKRSFIALDNLIDFIILCIEHPHAANQVFLVSDGEDISTTNLLKLIAEFLGKKSLLFSVNQNVIKFVFKILGKKSIATRLCGSLQMDISKAKTQLNWIPKVSVNDGLKNTMHAYLNS